MCDNYPEIKTNPVCPCTPEACVNAQACEGAANPLPGELARLRAELDRQRERANEAVGQVGYLRAIMDRRHELHDHLAAALGVTGMDGDRQVEAALARVAALEAVAKAARKSMGGLNLAATYFTRGDDWEWGNGDRFDAGKVRHAAKTLRAALAALEVLP